MMLKYLIRIVGGKYLILQNMKAKGNITQEQPNHLAQETSPKAPEECMTKQRRKENYPIQQQLSWSPL
jgi:hypothetical protein